MTLLFHAVASGNLSAVEALLGAGADPYMYDRMVGSDRNFVYVLTLPGGPLLDLDGVNQMLASYLAHGGDPNGTYGDITRNQGNLADGLALIGNNTGLCMVLDQGADPWTPTFNSGAVYSTAIETLAGFHNFEMLHELVDRGHFTARSQTELDRFLSALGGYAQRGDEMSLDIQKVTKRVLKRNPDYVEPVSADIGTRRIFKNHWTDPLPGLISWDEILSEAVD